MRLEFADDEHEVKLPVAGRLGRERVLEMFPGVVEDSMLIVEGARWCKSMWESARQASRLGTVDF